MTLKLCLSTGIIKVTLGRNKFSSLSLPKWKHPSFRVQNCYRMLSVNTDLCWRERVQSLTRLTSFGFTEQSCWCHCLHHHKSGSVLKEPQRLVNSQRWGQMWITARASHCSLKFRTGSFIIEEFKNFYFIIL